MLKTLALALVLAVAPAALLAQTEKQIASIRSEVNLINKAAPKYQKKTESVEGVSLEGAEATYFTSGRGLKKIVAKIYGETYRATAEIYYSGEEMIFAYQRLEKYDTHVAMTPPPKVTKVVETRVYCAGADAIRVLEGKKQLAAGDAAYDEAVAGMRELSDKLKAAMQP